MEMTPINTLPKDIQNIIYKYIHRDALKQVHKEMDLEILKYCLSGAFDKFYDSHKHEDILKSGWCGSSSCHICWNYNFNREDTYSYWLRIRKTPFGKPPSTW